MAVRLEPRKEAPEIELALKVPEDAPLPAVRYEEYGAVHGDASAEREIEIDEARRREGRHVRLDDELRLDHFARAAENAEGALRRRLEREADRHAFERVLLDPDAPPHLACRADVDGLEHEVGSRSPHESYGRRPAVDLDRGGKRSLEVLGQENGPFAEEAVLIVRVVGDLEIERREPGPPVLFEAQIASLAPGFRAGEERNLAAPVHAEGIVPNVLRVADAEALRPEKAEVVVAADVQVACRPRDVAREGHAVRREEEAVEALVRAVVVEEELPDVAVGEHLAPDEGERLVEVPPLPDAGLREYDLTGLHAERARGLARLPGRELDAPVVEHDRPAAEIDLAADEAGGRCELEIPVGNRRGARPAELQRAAELRVVHGAARPLHHDAALGLLVLALEGRIEGHASPVVLGGRVAEPLAHGLEPDPGLAAHAERVDVEPARRERAAAPLPEGDFRSRSPRDVGREDPQPRERDDRDAGGPPLHEPRRDIAVPRDGVELRRRSGNEPARRSAGQIEPCVSLARIVDRRGEGDALLPRSRELAPEYFFLNERHGAGEVEIPPHGEVREVGAQREGRGLPARCDGAPRREHEPLVEGAPGDRAAVDLEEARPQLDAVAVGDEAVEGVHAPEGETRLDAGFGDDGVREVVSGPKVSRVGRDRARGGIHRPPGLEHHPPPLGSEPET